MSRATDAEVLDQTALPSAYTDTTTEDARTAQLSEHLTADHVVIGGGITGCSAALHLAETGQSVVQLEAGDISCGGSGRAFGTVVPCGKHSETHVLAQFGPEAGERHIQVLAEGPDLIRKLIARYDMKDTIHGQGWILAPHVAASHDGLRKRAAFWQARGADVELLEGEALHHSVGSDRYDLAFKDNRALAINPYSYTLGLARAARDKGVQQFTRTPAISYSRKGSQWVVATPEGRVTARRLLVCTNAYSGTFSSRTRRAFVRVRGHQAVTNPIPQNVFASILPDTGALMDTRHTWSGIKKLPGNRLHFSAGGSTLSGTASADLNSVQNRLKEMYPQIADVGWQSNWSGWVALTSDQFPHIGRLGDGAWSGFGYNGRGLAGATLMGRELARIASGDTSHQPFVPVSDVRPLPFHVFGKYVAAVMIHWYRLSDAMEMRRNRT